MAVKDSKTGLNFCVSKVVRKAIRMESAEVEISMSKWVLSVVLEKLLKKYTREELELDS